MILNLKGALALCGTKKGKFKATVEFMFWRAGLLGALTTVEFARVERVLFVCSGNICRSPYAEVKLASQGFSCESFGLSTTPGIPADARAVKVAEGRGIDLSTHRSKQAGSFSISASDLLLGMTPDHCRELKKLKIAGGAQVSLLGIYATPAIPIVGDPFQQSESQFEKCFDVIDSAVNRLGCLLEKSSR